MQVAFSGTNYPLEIKQSGLFGQSSTGKLVLNPIIRLMSGTVKGVMSVKRLRLTPEALEAKPRGTLVSFSFPTKDRKVHVKTFLFD